MAKYSRRADGRYEAAVTIIIDGEKKKKHLYAKTVRELDDKIAEVRAQANRGGVVDDRAVTLGEWAELWLERKKLSVSYNTYHGYENSVRVHIVPMLRDIRLKDLKKHHLQSVLDVLIKEGKLPTAEKVRITIGQLIDEAVDNDYIYKNIAKNLSLPTKKAKEKRALTAQEQDALNTADLSPMQKAFVDTLLCTGIRRGEALALGKDDINLDKKTITINKTLIFGKNQSTIQLNPKTLAGVREIPIPDKLCIELAELLEDVGEVVFSKQNGERMTRTGFRRFWEQIKKNVEKSTGVALGADVTPHLFRHTYATKLFHAGVDVKTAQYLLGHSSVSVTLGIYTHLDKQNVNTFADKVNKLFN